MIFSNEILIVQVLLTVLCLTMTVFRLYQFFLWQREGVIVTGSVTSFDDANKDAQPTPIVTFQGQDGAMYTVRITTLRASKTWQLGEACAVRYLPQQPKLAFVEGDSSLSLQAGIFLAPLMGIWLLPIIISIVQRSF